MRPDLPTGTVTFLFTDVEGSTRLLHELGAEGYADALAEHRRVIREACAAEGGAEVDTQGDAFFFAFPTASGALEAAQSFTQALVDGPVRVRVGLHTGTAHLGAEGYVGSDVHFAARVAATGHGGQVVLSAATADLVEVSLTSLGSHRLKDVPDPVTIYQLGEHAFPRLKTIANSNLPTPASSFLGREEELYEADAQLQETRLLTVTGPGGQGKTRFALELATRAREERFSDYEDGIYCAFLSTLRDPSLVLVTIAVALSVREQPGQSAAEALTSHLEGKRVLLLLDNLEHLPQAWPELSQLLSAYGGLTILCTSRERLRLQGERVFELPPLAEDESVSLFCERAQTEPDAGIRELCRRLEGLPLAIELAAARTSVLAPRQISTRLSQRLDFLKGGPDRDPRQETLRATIEWSYDLLSPEEQTLFARLSVFAGGCTLEAAEQVCEADLDSLQSLVEKSLVRFTDGRYWMLETIREYARERLEASGEADELWRRHAEHFLALAEEAQPHLWEVSAREFLDRLEAEHANLRAALDHLEVSGETQRALRLTGALWRFWNLRGPLPEGSRRLESALAADERPTAARAGALTGAAAMAARRGDVATARIRAEQATELHRELGDAWGIALSQSYIATAAAEERDWARAQEIAEECVRAFREAGDEHYAMLATWLLAWMCRELGDRERSRALIEENLRRSRALGNERVEAMSLDALAMLAVDEGRLQDALAMLKEAYRIHCDVGERLGIALDLCRFARALAVAGRAGTAAQLLSRGEALREEIGATLESWAAMEAKLRETLTVIRAQLAEAAFAEAWEQGRVLTVDEAVALALDSID